MIAQIKWMIRECTSADRYKIGDLLSSAGWYHQHLDWLDALDLLHHKPFLMAQRSARTIACLACPPDPSHVSWIRLFASAVDLKPSLTWEPLWSQASDMLCSMGVVRVAALLSVDWFAPILRDSEFKHTNDVVFLVWKQDELPRAPSIGGFIRPMLREDLKAIVEIDRTSFGTIWQYSIETMQHAYDKAAWPTVIEVEGVPVAYQISTTSHYGAHLARLAVTRNWQGHGFGKALVIDALKNLAVRRKIGMSVNTQADNTRSLQLYQRLGFEQTGTRHPVYEIELQSITGAV